MTRKTDKALVLLSGGQDSRVGIIRKRVFDARKASLIGRVNFYPLVGINF